MEKLGALDANFLYTETDQMPNHIASVQIMSLPADTPSDAFIAGLKRYLDARIHLVDYLTRKVKFIPGNLDHPVWVYDEDFAIDRHVIEVPMPEPGNHAQLETIVADLHSSRMDLSKPLWMLYVITGLADGKVAYYNQIHHAAVDGMSGQAATQILMDESADHRMPEPPATVPAAETNLLEEMFRQTFSNLLQYQLDAAVRMTGQLDAARRLYHRSVDPSLGLGALVRNGPRTRFNHAIHAARTFATGEVKLADLKRVGKPLGATINDVVMAICAGGLRRYLSRHDELPEQSLIAGCPVSLRDPLDKTSMGNNVTLMNVDLATDESSPLARLLRIRQSAATAKGVTADMAAGYFPNVSLPGLPMMLQAAAAMGESTAASEHMPVPFNVLISNVPGPRNTLYSNGAEMLTHYPVSIPAHGVGLNITVQSYGDTLFIGVTACAKALPDADLFRDDLLAAFDELRQLGLPTSLESVREARKPHSAGVEAEPVAESRVA